MKQKNGKWFQSDLFILACIAVFVLLCCIALGKVPYANAAINRIFFEYVEKNQVEYVSGPGGELSADQEDELIWLVNSARYKGKDRECGTTPVSGFTVCFRDGTQLIVEDCGDNVFWVRPSTDPKNAYFIESKRLRAFLAEVTE